jgi:hypothetical protein
MPGQTPTATQFPQTVNVSPGSRRQRELNRTGDGGHMDLQALRYAAMVSATTSEQLADIYPRHLDARASDQPQDARGRRNELPALFVHDLVEWAAVRFRDRPQRTVSRVADPEQVADLVVVGHAPCPDRARQIGTTPKRSRWLTGMTAGLLLSPEPGAPLRYTQFDTGGTSLATPLVAGMVIAAQQGQAAPFGFTDPAFYKLAGTAAFFPTLPLTNRSPALDRSVVCPQPPNMSCPLPPPPYTFDQQLFTFDDQSVNMAGYTGQVTLPGYDNMTGLGTPDGPNFIKALRKLER